ncbi:MAG: hypothetical protein KDJ31_03650 [Candidatus Competibacteraceae bacterium]|nr:hypothetical protein [Candidatus Competibacteraceae bacterium]MCB1821254.1 hypothetical protein [Candidatus Competibacteraceae bacterium]
MDVATVAAGVTTALVPALPFLVKAGEQSMETLGEKIGEGMAETAKALWRKLWPAVKANPTATAVVEDVAAAPEDEDARAALRRQIKKLLEADSSLLAGLAQVLEAANPQHYQAANFGDGSIAQGSRTVAAGKGGLAIGRDLHGGVNIGRKE